MLKNNGFHNRHSPFNKAFSPISLFANGEQGWWYDPSNFATLFQDSAGTTPVTAVEQPVGLQLDLSGRNNHRFQTTSANRPVVSARVNLLIGTATLATQSVTTRATAYTLTFTGAGSITLTGTAIGVYTAGTHSVTTTAGTLTATVLGTVTQADLRETNVGVGLPAYQAVVTSTNYDTAGFPVYIRANGSNQFLVTNSINFSATDKMTTWMGVRSLTAFSGARGMLVELSTLVTNAGAFALDVTPDVYRIFGVSNSGNLLSTILAPIITNVITGQWNESSISLRGNGTLNATGTQVSASFGNYPAYFYARAGTGVFFNGNDYGSIARGAASTATQITDGETWINQRCKAY